MLDSAYLIEEINKSLQWFSLKGLVSLLWIVVVGFTLFFIFQNLFNYLDQRGWSKKFYVPSVRVLFNLSFPILFVVYAIFFVAHSSLLFELAGLVCLVSMLILFLTELSRGLLPAIGILVTAGLSEEDWVQIGRQTGRLRRVGLFRCQLVSPQGEFSYIPTRLIGRQGIKRLPRGMVHPLEINLTFQEGQVNNKLLGRLEKHLYLSPYRAKDGKIRLERSHDHQVKVLMDLLSDKYQDQGEIYVKKIQNLILEENPNR